MFWMVVGKEHELSGMGAEGGSAVRRAPERWGGRITVCFGISAQYLPVFSLYLSPNKIILSSFIVKGNFSQVFLPLGNPEEASEPQRQKSCDFIWLGKIINQIFYYTRSLELTLFECVWFVCELLYSSLFYFVF